MKYLCSIPFELHVTGIDAHDFYKCAKKVEENSTIKFFFLSTDDYKRSLSLLLEAYNGIESEDSSMKLHAAFPSTSNKLWVRNTSCFCQNCFGTIFKPETVCDGWIMVDLQQKRNPSILSNTENAAEITENEAAIVLDINGHVAAVYDRKVYICKMLEMDDSNAKISFYEQSTTLSVGSIFRNPKTRDEIWVDLVNILCVGPVPAETTRKKEI